MADLSSIRQTTDNSGNAIAAAYAPANLTAGNDTQGLAGRTIIVNVAKTNITSAELGTIVTAIQRGGLNTKNATNGDDAFVVAGITTPTGAAFSSGVTDNVVLALQGTGTFTADDANAYGITADSGAVTTILADFLGLQS
jgi:hypothetical protein